MHELAIAEAVVRIAGEHAGGRPVTRVELKAGALRQVVPASLEFAFALLVAGTAIEGAELVIETVPAAGTCAACGAWSAFDSFPLRCRSCGGLDVQLRQGEELLVDAIEIEDAAIATNQRTHRD